MGNAIEHRSPSALSHDALRQRLRDLARDERDLQVDFLLHLAEFDDRRGFAEAGYDSLWTFCLRELHLREGPAALRIQAMRLLRQHPRLEAALRDGRLCLTTAVMIGPLLQELPVDDVVARAAYLTKDEVRQFVTSLHPTTAPRDGIRQLPVRDACAEPRRDGAQAVHGPLALSVVSAGFQTAAAPDAATILVTSQGSRMFGSERDLKPSANLTPSPGTPAAAVGALAGDAGSCAPGTPAADSGAPPGSFVTTCTPAMSERARSRVELTPVSGEQWSLRVTMDSEMKQNLEALRDLVSHKTGRDLAAVLREALRCGLEKHGKRRGAVAPTRARRGAPPLAQAAARMSRLAAPSEPTTHAGDRMRESDAPVHVSEAPAASATPAATEAPAAIDAPVIDARVIDARGAATKPDERRTAAAKQHGTSDPRSISAAVARAVWRRDEGCCTWTTSGGRRCRSRWKLQIDHVRPVALGGKPTVDNLRLLCRTHNLLYAEKTFGVQHMNRYRKDHKGRRASAQASQGSLTAQTVPH